MDTLFPPKVVASVANWELWQSLHGQYLAPCCDWVELRVDALPAELPAEQVMAYKPDTPVLVTARAQEEGGMCVLPLIKRLALLQSYLPYVQAIDIEIAAMPYAKELVEFAKRRRVTVISSAHDFEMTPDVDYLRLLEQKAMQHHADVVKFAFKLINPNDLQIGVQLLTDKKMPMAVMGMGALGPVSRLLYAQLGSCLVYGYPGEEATAPGQWPSTLIKQTLTHLTPVMNG